MDARTMFEHRVFRWLPFAIAVAILSGCSTLAGEKLGKGGDGKQIAPTGVPYSLVRPEYTIARTPPPEGEKKPSYTLAVTYEPDPNQRYTIRLDPALFSDPDFLLKLSTSGTVTGTTAKATEQISTTITAIGQFAASVAKAAAVFDAYGTRGAIKDAMKSATAAASCINVRTTLQRPPYLDLSRPWTSVADAISVRMDGYASDAEFNALFEYQTLDEQACLKTAQEALTDLSRHDPKKALDAWTTELAAFKVSQAGDSPFAEKITKAVGAADETTLIKEQAANANVRPITPFTRDRDALISKALETVRAEPTPLAATQLTAIVKMNTATWLARHVLYTEREIEQTSLYLLRNPDLRRIRSRDIRQDPVFQAEEYIRSMREERAATLGVTVLARRVDALTWFLSSVRQKDIENGSAPATAEFATARAELDAALAQIDIRRARVLADAKPAPIAALPPTKVTPVTREEMDKILTTGWASSGHAAPAPELLMVLEEVK